MRHKVRVIFAGEISSVDRYLKEQIFGFKCNNILVLAGHLSDFLNNYRCEFIRTESYVQLMCKKKSPVRSPGSFQ